MSRLLDDYLHKIDARRVVSACVFSSSQRTRILPVPPGERRTPWFPLADLALILFQMPLSESSVERVFSILREILGKRRQTMKGDLVEARLTLMFHDRQATGFVDRVLGGEVHIDGPVYETEHEMGLAAQSLVH
jgi:hypothetical protein